MYSLSSSEASTESEKNLADAYLTVDEVLAIWLLRNEDAADLEVARRRRFMVMSTMVDFKFVVTVIGVGDLIS